MYPSQSIATNEPSLGVSPCPSLISFTNSIFQNYISELHLTVMHEQTLQNRQMTEEACWQRICPTAFWDPMSIYFYTSQEYLRRYSFLIFVWGESLIFIRAVIMCPIDCITLWWTKNRLAEKGVKGGRKESDGVLGIANRILFVRSHCICRPEDVSKILSKEWSRAHLTWHSG